MSHNTVVVRLKIYAVGVLTLAGALGVAGFARGSAEVSGTPPQVVRGVTPEAAGAVGVGLAAPEVSATVAARKRVEG
jgi:hypothetical protein